LKIDVIGVPVDLGADRRGVDMGPSAIRYAHLNQGLRALGYTVEDRGNVEVPIAERCAITDPKLKYLDCILPMARRVAGAVATSVQEGSFPLVLGGDHSLSLGSIRGAARHKKLGVLWIDAHADFNTPETTPSGNIHGMPLAALCGLGDPRLAHLWGSSSVRYSDPDRASLGTPPPTEGARGGGGEAVLDPHRVAVLGARDLDPGEKRNLREAGVLVLGMEQLDRLGMVAALEMAFERITRDADGIYLSFDMDALDPRHAPGVGTPVMGGLTYREAHLACELAAETGKLVGMDLVEVNPILDSQNQTALLAVDFARSALGSRIWGG
jgi:arginase